MIITLLGYMGSGKSTAGKKLAKKLGYNFIDLDDFIEIEEGKTISQIFENGGEPLFRQIEQEALKACLKKENTVLSLGGGTPIFEDNMQLVNQKSTSVYIKMDAKALANRLQGGQENRPLIKGLSKPELVDFIETNLKKRREFYRQANYIIEGRNLKTQDLVKLIRK